MLELISPLKQVGGGFRYDPRCGSASDSERGSGAELAAIGPGEPSNREKMQ